MFKALKFLYVKLGGLEPQLEIIEYPIANTEYPTNIELCLTLRYKYILLISSYLQ